MQNPEERFHRFISEFNELTLYLVRLFKIIDKKANYPATAFQYYTLQSLKDTKGMTMKQLSTFMGLASSTMTRNIDKLVKKGYLERRRSELDRREIYIRITPKGKELTKKIQEAERDFSQKLFKEIPENEWKNILSALNFILKVFQKRKEVFFSR